MPCRWECCSSRVTPQHVQSADRARVQNPGTQELRRKPCGHSRKCCGMFFVYGEYISTKNQFHSAIQISLQLYRATLINARNVAYLKSHATKIQHTM